MTLNIREQTTTYVVDLPIAKSDRGRVTQLSINFGAREDAEVFVRAIQQLTTPEAI